MGVQIKKINTDLTKKIYINEINFERKPINRMQSQPPTNLFTYGSLMYPQVIYTLVSEKTYQTHAAVLKGFSRRQVKGKSYPGLLKSEDAEVEGLLYLCVIPKDVAILHGFEGREYIPTEVEVETDGGRVAACVYLSRNPETLE
jgi:gamma-glutamylcyclotransferase (GGCT)/AIG2-like uncharacterized protein YtfP